jgi:hypothetical protein
MLLVRPNQSMEQLQKQGGFGTNNLPLKSPLALVVPYLSRPDLLSLVWGVLLVYRFCCQFSFVCVSVIPSSVTGPFRGAGVGAGGGWRMSSQFGSMLSDWFVNVNLVDGTQAYEVW